MDKKMLLIGICLLWVLAGSGAIAQQGLIIYPAKGQSQEQVERDKYDCYQWARQQTGFDPMQAAQTSSPPKEAPKGGVVRGAAGGAAVGAAVGAIGGNAGKGAAMGAVGGGLVGGMRRSAQVREQQYAAQQQATLDKQKRDLYNRAFGACLEGRGYTVK